ncbi:unnamed protein product [Rotaria sordida]|uniref:Uncharacterized protein n=1 Tax=Rotaria sordida TaxID=392033 RepID=A0A814AQL9_9BILA|nr:unnamed protein product [Rotaria sordida]CAF0972388.1 unnamed protein product [Rotaria sordida]CAF1004163.1 unnamed protein product [Rotaria sordida]CAF3647234.1 unnamed protein product [Rotaria sordida]CAF3661967.1 unnamed protein product [Rotaria sordida]
MRKQLTTINGSITSIESSVPFGFFVYALDSQCETENNDSSALSRTKKFDEIFDKRYWGSKESLSGGGSTLEGAFDWIRHLRSLFYHLPIRSVADVPCGDTYWQFSLQEINTIEQVYFGGDISRKVIEQNRRLYQSSHRNKIFQVWDIVRCPIPTFTFKNETHELKGNDEFYKNNCYPFLKSLT